MTLSNTSKHDERGASSASMRWPCTHQSMAFTRPRKPATTRPLPGPSTSPRPSRVRALGVSDTGVSSRKWPLSPGATRSSAPARRPSPRHCPQGPTRPVRAPWPPALAPYWSQRGSPSSPGPRRAGAPGRLPGARFGRACRQPTPALAGAGLEPDDHQDEAGVASCGKPQPRRPRRPQGGFSEGRDDAAISPSIPPLFRAFQAALSAGCMMECPGPL
jgi:hypothetical protein